MSATKNNHSAQNGEPSDRQSENINLSAPLGSLKSGCLVFASGARRLELKAGPSMPYLYQARFKRYVPRVWVQEDILTIQYGRFPFIDRLANLRRPLAEINLNGSIPWEIEFRNGVSHFNADLRQLQLRSLDILSGARRIRLMLSRPSGTTYIYILGGISKGLILVPPGAYVSAQVSGGATNLVFDNQRFGTIEGETSLVSPGLKGAKGGYDIRIAGGASNLTIERQG